MSSEWINWEGKGEAPTGMVFVQLRDGDESKEPYDAGKFYWDHDNSPSDIAAYKLATSAVDMVNNPPHYKQGAVECIDAIRAALTPAEFRGHCRATAIKYIWREAHKGQDESIKKAIWYLEAMLK